MNDLKSKIKATAEKAKQKLEESNIQDKIKDAAEMAQQKLEESNIQEKLKDTAEKAKQKLDESGVQEKVGETLTKENADMVMDKAKCATNCVKKVIEKLNISAKTVILGSSAVAAVATVVIGASMVFGEPAPRPVQINNQSVDYVYSKKKLFGTAVDIENGSNITLTPKKVIIEGIGFKIKSILQTHVHIPGQTNTSVNDLYAVITIINPIMGGTIEMLLQKAVFKAGDEELNGYKVYMVDSKAKKMYTSHPDAKIIFTKYYTNEELKK